jgi:hypothetical protein
MLSPTGDAGSPIVVGPLAADSSRLGGEPGAGRIGRKVTLAQVGELQAGQEVHGITSTGNLVMVDSTD